MIEPTVSKPMFDVEAVRQDFPALLKPLPKGMPVVYLDTAASAQKPHCVIDKQTEICENYYANAHRGTYQFGAKIDEELEAARENVRALIGAAEVEEIIFTSGTTMSINLVANAWGRKFLRPGDEILLNVMEHHANLVPWQQIAAEKEATLNFIPLTADGRLDLNRLDDVLTDRTRLVAVTGMSNVLGTINPMDAIVSRAKEHDALVLVDGAQNVSHASVDVQHPQIDFLAFSGHKLYGPTGIGVLYGRRELLEAMDPFLCGGHMIDRVYRERSTWAEPPAKFEAGTLPIVEAIALGTAIEYVTGIGLEVIHEHEKNLLRYAHARLAEIPGTTIYGPPLEHKGAIVSFTVKGIHPEDLAIQLDRRGVFARHGHHCTMPLHEHLGVSATTRVSFGMYNTEAEIDALHDAIQFARERFRLG
jgi:cysteine desulfurase/selenocysteine lyase